jgi:hypothetical protein
MDAKVFALSMATAVALAVLPPGEARGACRILATGGAEVSGLGDPLAALFVREPTCPQNVREFRALLTRAGAQLRPTFVANRGFHNPGLGSFSLFEIVTGAVNGLRLEPGDLFFGHFTGAVGERLILDQTQRLMVEVIAWDDQKGMFNFYELIREKSGPGWFYRGDSGDIVADVSGLHRQDGPQFGPRLRCSGCHVAGGPIMKELAPPHNDWWLTNRRLPLGGRQPDAALGEILNGLVDASELASSVEAGVAKLNASAPFKALRTRLSLQEKLRPLFCPMELNLASDTEPLDSQTPTVGIPSAFLIDVTFLTERVPISRSHYHQALTKSKARFPETTRADGDHAWLTPVKAHSDRQAIAAVIRDGMIDEEFAADVLAVDMTNPVFSTARCKLLRLVPAKEAPGWKDQFVQALRQRGGAAGTELIANLTQANRTLNFHKQRAEALVTRCRTTLTTVDATASLYRLLATRRQEAFDSPISSDPNRQILEPGFRVIFPEVNPRPRSGSLKLTDQCTVESAR